MSDDAARRSVQSVADRLLRLPDALRGTLTASREADAGCARQLSAARSIVATGVGGSSGPARALVAELAAHGLPARFMPMSAFVDPGFGDSASTLVLFSQRLSPNARLALRAAPRFAGAIVCTTVDEATLAERTDGSVVARRLPDLHEPATLLRLLGPACATLDALRLAAQLITRAGATPRFSERDVDDAIDCVAGAQQRAAAAAAAISEHDDDAVSFITFGGYDAWAHGLAGIWQEGLLVAAPQIHDALAFAHGPLQQMYPQRATLVALTHDGDPGQLRRRLRAALAPQRHCLVELASALAPPLCLLDHGALVGWLLHAALQRRPRDLFDWPGKDADAPLYQLGAEGEP